MKSHKLFALLFTGFMIGQIECMARELPPPKDDYMGDRFRERVDTYIVEGDTDRIFTGYIVPFMKELYRLETDEDMRSEFAGEFDRADDYDKWLVRETSRTQDEVHFKRLKLVYSLNDLKGYVDIRSTHDALEYLRLASSAMTENVFHKASTAYFIEIHCRSDFVETAPYVASAPVASSAECEAEGFTQPDGPFDLEIANVKRTLVGALSITATEILANLEHSLRVTTTREKTVDIDFQPNRAAGSDGKLPDGKGRSELATSPLRIKVEGQNLTDEEQEWVATLQKLVSEGGLRVKLKLDAKVDMKKVPEYFDITRTVAGPNVNPPIPLEFARITERVGRDGSWKIIRREPIKEGSLELAKKFYSRYVPE